MQSFLHCYVPLKYTSARANCGGTLLRAFKQVKLRAADLGLGCNLTRQTLAEVEASGLSAPLDRT